METELLIATGNQCRTDRNPEGALAHYAQAFIQDRTHAGAFCNYGNVLRECGDPVGAIPFLQRSIQLDPSNPVSQFNLAVAYLLAGDYQKGWSQYETRWNYEHLAGSLPNFSQPRWNGEDLTGKTILVLAEQGHGDNIQFVRFVGDLVARGGAVHLHVDSALAPLFQSINKISKIIPKAKSIFDMVDIHFLRYKLAIELEPTRISLRKKYKKYLS